MRGSGPNDRTHDQFAPMLGKKLWDLPYYHFRDSKGAKRTIDVTTSASPGLPPNELTKKLIKLFKRKDVESIVDFGAGTFRHTLPFLKAGFQVCAVEFEEAFKRDEASAARTRAERNPNFSKLIWPRDFRKDRRKFDAALLIYVLQTMPIHSERKAVLKYLYQKLNTDSYLFYMSRFNQVGHLGPDRRCKDGYFMYPERKVHSFYRDFTAEETHALFAKFRFKRDKSLSQRGTDQAYLYVKGKATWV
jgi:SAM-dependent methyltransferase